MHQVPITAGGPRQCGIQSFTDTSTHDGENIDQCWELNPIRDLESNFLSTWPHVPVILGDVTVY